MTIVKSGDYIAFYGTLRGRTNRNPHMEYVSNGRVRGRLLNVGSFPALVDTNSDKEVVVEIQQVHNPDIVAGHFDSYEGYRPHSEDSSLYLRRQLPVTKDDGEELMAWVYLWNRDHNLPEIESGDWFER